MNTYSIKGNEHLTVESTVSELMYLPATGGLFQDYTVEGFDYTAVIPAGQTVRADYFWGYKDGSIKHTEVFDLCVKVDVESTVEVIAEAMYKLYIELMRGESASPRTCYGVEQFVYQENGEYKFYFGT